MGYTNKNNQSVQITGGGDTTALEQDILNVNNKVEQVSKSNIQPLYVETLASFSRYGTGVPTGVSNYTGGNYVLMVDGVKGQGYFTVTAGNIADAGSTKKWAAILEKNDLTYSGYKVTGTDGNNKVYVYPNVRENITGGKLANLHDADQGQHYTEKGYKAFGQHIFNNSGYHSQRSKYIARFLGNDTSGKWVGVNGVSSITFNRGLNPVDTTDGILEGDNDRNLTFNTDAVDEGIEWEVAIDKSTGYFEGFIGIMSGSPVKVEFYLNDILQKTKTVNRELERLVFDFDFGNKAKIRITSLTADATTVRVGNCFWWLGEKIPQNIFNKASSKAVYIGDSWGMYHNQTNPKEIERKWKEVNPNATVVNRSESGMTSKYARKWFQQYVLDEKPDIVIIEYFTNDINTILLPSNGLTRTDPDGNTYNTAVTEAEYFENLRYMTDTAIKNGIQPIIVLPSAVAGDTQTQYHAKYSAKLAQGGSILPMTARFSDVTAESASLTKVLADVIETKTDVNTTLDLITSYYGAKIKPRVMMYGGTPFQIVNNNDNELFSVSVFGGTGSTSDTVTNTTALGLKGLSSLPTASSTHRGKITMVKGGTGVADGFYVCKKKADDAYTWVQIDI